MPESVDVRSEVSLSAASVPKRVAVTWGVVLGLIAMLALSLWLLARPQRAVANISGYAPSITPVMLVDGLTWPVHVTHAGDGTGRLFIVEKAGVIRVFDGGTLLDTPFLDIQSRVGSAGNEQGLLSVAFPPDYATSGEFYVNYTDNNGDTVVARYAVSGDLNEVDAGSEEIVLTVQQPFDNHNGGQLAFGPDGYLYVGLGDGGSGGDPQDNAQNPAELLGKMLRLDVTGASTYMIPPDNPFTEANDPTDAYRDEIWARGLRNPWRFAFDRLLGDLFVGDVGQGSWEEIDYQPATSSGGENYGWRCYEGNHPYNTSGCLDADQYVFPILEYAHAGSRSVTGGMVYRGARFPHVYGFYFYADYITGEIWSARRVDGNWENSPVHDASYSISSFGEDESGEIYVVRYAGAPNGAIYQLTDPAFSLCDADYDGDDMIDRDDVTALESYWPSQDGGAGSYDPTRDLIYDGVVAADDFIWLAMHISEDCP